MSYEDQEVVLLSKDEREFKLKFGIALMSETIKALSSFPEDEDDQADWEVPPAAIPLPPVEGAILAKVLAYCTYHTENKEAKEDERDAWDKKFAGVDDDTLFSLILAANYLDIKNDFTPEEEEEVRKENAWCEER